MNRRVTRRGLLGALAGGVAGLAGCGYRPGGGEYRWSAGVLYGADRMTLDGGALLVVAREATSFDIRTDRWSDGGNVATVDPERGEWMAEYGFGEPTVTAALGSDSVYAGTTAGTVAAVPVEADPRDLGEPETGTATPEPEGWTVGTGVAPTGVTALATAAGGSVFAGGRGGLAALSGDGTVRWRWEDGAVDAVVPGVGDTAVHAVTTDRLVALAADGTVRWTRNIAREGAGAVPVPRAGSRGVYFADAEGLTALARDGSVRWRRDVGGTAAEPTLTGNGVYHASADGVVRSFSLDGRERWAHGPRGGIRSRVAAAGGRAYVVAGGELVGVGPGGTAWRVPLDEPEPFTPEFGPFVAGRTLVLGSAGEVRGYWRSQLR